MNLLTDEGIRRIALASVGRIKLSNPQLDAELLPALKVLAAGPATAEQNVTMEVRGQGGRTVRVGYSRDAPGWRPGASASWAAGARAIPRPGAEWAKKR